MEGVAGPEFDSGLRATESDVAERLKKDFLYNAEGRGYREGLGEEALLESLGGRGGTASAALGDRISC